MAKTNFQTVDEYHQTFSGEALERLKSIRKIVHDVAPGAVEGISYQIPCFKYNNSYLIYYCAFPKHVSISHPFSAAFWEHFKADLEGYKTSKAVIQFPTDKPLPEKMIREIVEFRKKEAVDKQR